MTKDPSHVRVSGLLKPFAPRFVEWLGRHGYTPFSAVFQLNLMAHWSRWLTAKGLDLHHLSMTEVERFLTARRRAGYTQYLSTKAMAPTLALLREQGIIVMPRPTGPPRPSDALLARYCQYLLQERGLGRATARGYVDAVRPFVRERVAPDGVWA